MKFLNSGIPQRTTRTDSVTHGVQARTTSAVPWPWSEVSALASATTLDSCPAAPKAAEVQMYGGCQTFRNSACAIIEAIDATTSTSHGPWEVETRTGGRAKAAP